MLENSSSIGCASGLDNGRNTRSEGLPFNGLARLTAIADALAQQDGFLAAVILHQHNTAVQHLLNVHRSLLLPLKP